MNRPPCPDNTADLLNRLYWFQRTGEYVERGHRPAQPDNRNPKPAALPKGVTFVRR